MKAIVQQLNLIIRALKSAWLDHRAAIELFQATVDQTQFIPYTGA